MLFFHPVLNKILSPISNKVYLYKTFKIESWKQQDFSNCWGYFKLDISYLNLSYELQNRY